MGVRLIISSFSFLKLPQKQTLKLQNFTVTNKKMPTTATSSFENNNNTRKLPILLFDVMDTIVRDPFYQDVPAFFGMSMKELLECKHPTAWIEFEKGLIDEGSIFVKPVTEHGNDMAYFYIFDQLKARISRTTSIRELQIGS